MVAAFFCPSGLPKLRRINPTGIFLLQPGLTVVGPDGFSRFRPVNATYVYGDGVLDSWPGAIDDLTSGESLGSIRPIDPSWDYLHNVNGSLAESDSTWHAWGWNLADPTNHGTAELVAKISAYAAKLAGLYSEGWDGISSDNWTFSAIGESWYFGHRLDTDRDGTVDDYTALHRNWSNGLTRVGNLLRSYLPGKIVGGNGNWYRPEFYVGDDRDGWLKSANYTLVENLEQFSNTPGKFIQIARRWLDYPDPYGQTRYIAALQNVVLPVPSGADVNQAAFMFDPAIMRSMRWGLTLSLMADAYYEIEVNGQSGYTLWWYDEYEGGAGVRRRGYLGSALGSPVELAKGVWRRDFVNGIALNNSTGQPQTVFLEATYRHLLGTQDPSANDGSLARHVTIPAHDGLILLRTTPTTSARSGGRWAET